MFREIVMGKGQSQKTIAFKSSGVTPLFYKKVFNKDLLQQLTNNDGNIELAGDRIPELAFIMAMQAQKADMTALNYDSFIEWLELFDPLDLVIHSTEIADVYIGDSITTVEPKKKGKDKQNG